MSEGELSYTCLDVGPMSSTGAFDMVRICHAEHPRSRSLSAITRPPVSLTPAGSDLGGLNFSASPTRSPPDRFSPPSSVIGLRRRPRRGPGANRLLVFYET